MKYVWIMDSILGHIGIIVDDTHLLNIFVGPVPFKAKIEETPLIKKVEKQLSEYFEGKRKKFDIPIKTLGTEFQETVWKELINIPYGTTLSYKELAKKIKTDKYTRAVGNANNKNPIPIIIPCHRVIGSRGDLVGYALGLEMKEKLLDIEKKYV